MDGFDAVCKIENLKTEQGKIVTWEFEGEKYTLSFENRFFQVVYSKAKNFLLILADYAEKGNRNLFIYDAKASLICNPEIPESKERILGIYSIWFVEGNENQTVVFATSKNADYDLKCEFSLSDFTFSSISLTR